MLSFITSPQRFYVNVLNVYLSVTASLAVKNTQWFQAKLKVTVFCPVAWKQDVILSPHWQSSANIKANVVVWSVDPLSYISSNSTWPSAYCPHGPPWSILCLAVKLQRQKCRWKSTVTSRTSAPYYLREGQISLPSPWCLSHPTCPIVVFLVPVPGTECPASALTFPHYLLSLHLGLSFLGMSLTL